jgi:hypothetical protein
MNDEYLRRAIRSMSSIGTISWFLMPNSTAVRTLKSSLERYLKTSTSSFIFSFLSYYRTLSLYAETVAVNGGSSPAEDAVVRRQQFAFTYYCVVCVRVRESSISFGGSGYGYWVVGFVN